MEARKATSLLALSLAFLGVLIGGCSSGDTPPGTTSQNFPEGTLSSDDSNEASQSNSGLAESTGPPPRQTLLRVEGGKRTRFSGLCTTANREYVISGRPSKTYVFEESAFSCRIQKQDSGAGNLKVTVVSGDSTRSVQQTNAEDGVVNVSRGASGDSR